MKPVTLCLAIFAFILLTFSCGGAVLQTGGGGDTPTDAYKKLYAAVKSKDVEAIKQQLTKKTIEFGKMAGEKNKNPDIYINGFTATTFADTLPTMRDERVNGDMGALEVWNSRDSKWEDLPFVKEDGGWKLAVGEVFAGTYQSPGKGRDQIEKEAANAVANKEQIPSVDTTNVNMNKIPIANAPPMPKTK